MHIFGIVGKDAIIAADIALSQSMPILRMMYMFVFVGAIFKSLIYREIEGKGAPCSELGFERNSQMSNDRMESG